MCCCPPGSSVHRDYPGRNTGVGCHDLLQAIFPIWGWNTGLLHCRQILYHLSHLGSSSCPNSCLYFQMRAWSNFRMLGKLIQAQRLAHHLTFSKTERLLLLWRPLIVWSTMFIVGIACEVCCKCRLLIFFINNRRRIMALTPKYF